MRPVFMEGTVKVNSCRPPGGPPMFQFPCPRPLPLPPPWPGGPPACTLLRRSVIISAACWALSGGPIIWAILSGVVPSSKPKVKHLCQRSECDFVFAFTLKCIWTYSPGLNWILTPVSFWIFLIISPFLPITIPTANLGTGT